MCLLGVTTPPDVGTATHATGLLVALHDNKTSSNTLVAAALVPPSKCATCCKTSHLQWDSSLPEDFPEVIDRDLASVCDLLMRLVPTSGGISSPAAYDMALEALLYIYLITHRQELFSGHLDRVVALDGGRCAMLLLAAEELEYPGGNYRADEKARSCVPPIVAASHAFLLRVSLLGVGTSMQQHGGLQVWFHDFPNTTVVCLSQTAKRSLLIV
jgi:hypothetical protein